MEDVDTFADPNIEYMEKCVLVSLLNMLRLLLCYYSDYAKEARILSIVFSYNTRKTPKQVMIELSVHQSTRSKNLVDVLHRCGHSTIYADVLAIRNTIAQNEIDSYV